MAFSVGWMVRISIRFALLKWNFKCKALNPISVNDMFCSLFFGIIWCILCFILPDRLFQIDQFWSRTELLQRSKFIGSIKFHFLTKCTNKRKTATEHKHRTHFVGVCQMSEIYTFLYLFIFIYAFVYIRCVVKCETFNSIAQWRLKMDIIHFCWRPCTFWR